jgi:hypothetical protein
MASEKTGEKAGGFGSRKASYLKPNLTKIVQQNTHGHSTPVRLSDGGFHH